MKYREALQLAQDKLHTVGIMDATTDAFYLLEFLTSMTRKDYLLQMETEIPQNIYLEYMELVERRATREPLQHITGVQEFMGIQFQVNSHVLIPRQDTELLVEHTVEAIRNMHILQQNNQIQYLDICTGSACIPISVAVHSKLETSQLAITASDISLQALEIATTNVRKIAPQIELLHSDLFDEIDGMYDVISSNPPYIVSSVLPTLEVEVRDYDPSLALDGGEDGLEFYRRIIEGCHKHLKVGGILLFEIGYDQGQAVSELMVQHGFRSVEVLQDLANLDRVVKGVREHDY